MEDLLCCPAILRDAPLDSHELHLKEKNSPHTQRQLFRSDPKTTEEPSYIPQSKTCAARHVRGGSRDSWNLRKLKEQQLDRRATFKGALQGGGAKCAANLGRNAAASTVTHPRDKGHEPESYCE